MNKNKQQQISELFGRIEIFKRQYFTFMKDNYIIEKEPTVQDLKDILYKRYRKEYINNTKINYFYDENLIPLKQYKGEASLKENEIIQMFNVSAISNEIIMINNMLENSLKMIEDSGFQNYLENNEKNLFVIEKKEFIEFNEIKSLSPDLEEFLVKYYIPNMKEILSQSGQLPEGILQSAPMKDNFLLYVLLTDLVVYDIENDYDGFRLKLNNLIRRFNLKYEKKQK